VGEWHDVRGLRDEIRRGVYTATDSIHRMTEGRSEEILLLEDARAPRRFEYEIEEVVGAAEVRAAGGTIEFVASDGKGVRIEAPWVVDARGEHHDGAARWDLGEARDDGRRSLALTVDVEGLEYPLAVDPSFSTTGSMAIARGNHTATLLPSGKVFVAGGVDPYGGGSAEVFDEGFGFVDASRPGIWSATSPASSSYPLTLTGSGFRGNSEASGGSGTQNSAANFPVVQIRSVDSGRVRFLAPYPNTSWSDSFFVSGDLAGFPPGPALVTVFTRGIPSYSVPVVVQ
jgi:hypothetical protein